MLPTPLSWIIAYVVLALSYLAAGEIESTRGLKPLTLIDERGSMITFSNSQALVIGNSAYTAGWSALPGVKTDVAAVKAALERQGFAVQVAMDLTKQGLADVLDTFIEEKAQVEDARVLVYYAGHGHTLNNVGYLVGVDAPKPEVRGFLRKSYEISQVKTKALQAKSRSVLFAFDSCFAGTVFTPMRGANSYLMSAAREPVRMFLTAGSADEQVPDRSFFREEFIAGIEGAADHGRTGYVSGSRLAVYLKEQVGNRARAAGITLTPQSGVSEQTGYNKGDFIFKVPDLKEDPAVAKVSVAVLPVSVLPGNGDFDLGDLGKRIETDRARAQWATWQDKMGKAFAQVQAFDQDALVSAEVKQAAWRKFLVSFAADNPFNQEDEKLRTVAQRALTALVTPVSSVSSVSSPVPPVVLPTVKAGDRPVWAVEIGKDQFGEWAKWQVKNQTQIMRRIPAGTFVMGSENGDRDERPAHQVAVSAFWLAETTVTQAMWQAVTTQNPSNFKGNVNRPVESVSWDDCQVFFRFLNELTPGLHATLPTEAQWEYACRAGTTGDYAGDLAAMAWYETNSGGSTQSVKTKQANAWGLYDMHGNVWQWCKDGYGHYSLTNPNNIGQRGDYVFRGGCWRYGAKDCRSAARNKGKPSFKSNYLGLRMAIPD